MATNNNISHHITPSYFYMDSPNKTSLLQFLSNSQLICNFLIKPNKLT